MFLPFLIVLRPNNHQPIQATNTGQLNTILTFYEIISPEVPSQFTDMPLPLLRRVLAVLTKTGRAQIIEGAEGGGVRFFTR